MKRDHLETDFYHSNDEVKSYANKTLLLKSQIRDLIYQSSFNLYINDLLLDLNMINDFKINDDINIDLYLRSLESFIKNINKTIYNIEFNDYIYKCNELKNEINIFKHEISEAKFNYSGHHINYDNKFTLLLTNIRQIFMEINLAYKHYYEMYPLLKIIKHNNDLLLQMFKEEREQVETINKLITTYNDNSAIKLVANHFNESKDDSSLYAKNLFNDWLKSINKFLKVMTYNENEMKQCFSLRKEIR